MLRRIEADGSAVRHVEIDDVVGPLRRNGVEEGGDEVAVRIDDRQALIGDDPIEAEIEEQRALAGARSSDDIDVLLEIFIAQFEKLIFRVFRNAHKNSFQPAASIFFTTKSTPSSLRGVTA